MPQKTNSLQDSDRMYVRVIDYIKQEITAGRLQIGSKLPPERTMAEMLGVSRNSVREAGFGDHGDHRQCPGRGTLHCQQL